MIATAPRRVISVGEFSIQSISLTHNLPMGSGFFVVQFYDRLMLVATTLVLGSELSFPNTAIDLSATHKIIAFKIDGGVEDGVWWVDDYVYDAGQRNIEFKSQGAGGASGELKTFTGQTLINQRPVSRTVIAVGIDGDTPQFLAQTQSNQQGQYTLEWRGYTGQILIAAMDDYGEPWESEKTVGVGERVRPVSPNGYVYQVSSAGDLGSTEPDWPELAGETVVSGSVVLVAHPAYRSKTAGPILIS